MTKYLIIIAGPTAVGKTPVAIEVAKHFHTDILSADSRQLYKELNIGVARPDEEQLKAVKHHFIATHSIQELFSAGDYEREAIRLLDELFQTKDVVVMCGGTGFYIQAVCEGFDEIPEIDPEIREQLNAEFRESGLVALQERLLALDPETYAQMDIQNPQRLIRALEVCLGTAQPYSSFKKHKEVHRNFIPLKIILNTDKEKLYACIDHRVDAMMQHGLLEEARSVFPYKENNALQTVGYRELFDHFEGKISLEEAVQQIKQHTRNYAKRQLTWFRKDKDLHWFEPQQLGDIISFIDERIK